MFGLRTFCLSLVYFIYSILFSLGLLLLLPHFLYQAVRHRKYITGITQRFGQVPITTGSRPVIWLHCVSVGEVMAARPVAASLMSQYESFDLVVSTTTVTGQRLAQEMFGELAKSVFFFPLDLSWTIRKSLKRIRPSLVLLMETEIWPSLIRACHQQQIPIAIINGRISPVSFRRYQFIKRFLSRVLNQLSLAVMQTEADADRLSQLGMNGDLLRVSGSIKFDAEASTEKSLPLTESLRQRFNLNGNRQLIIAASTHPPEEKILLDAYRQLSAPGNKPRLLIAPRHPERFEEIARLIANSEFTWTRRSLAPLPEQDQSADLILLDSIGELRALYSLASIVFVGGSIAPTGGHNILEPALASCSIITGPHTANFTSIVKTFLKANALIQLPVLHDENYSEELARKFILLLNDEASRSAYGQRAREVVEHHKGASERTIQFLAPLLESENSSGNYRQSLLR